MAMDAGGRDGSVQSVDRAISILQVLARRGVTSVTALADELELHKSTVSRLLGTLVARGLVEHLPGRGGYRLDHGVALLAQGVTKPPDLTVTSRPVCAQLAEELGETVNVVVLEDHQVVTVDQVIGGASLTAVNWIGRRLPLHVTASGKVFLAALTSPELDAALAAGLPRFTEHTIVDATALREQLELVRERGYGWVREEQEIGLVAVAAPIRAMDGRVVAVLAASGPTFRLEPDRLDDLAALVRAASDRISELNGRPRTG